jgi:hypothetical protein
VPAAVYRSAPTSSAARRIRHMVPCMMIAFASLRSTMPISKNPAYSAFIAAWTRLPPVTVILRRLDDANCGIREARCQEFRRTRPLTR